MWIQISAKNSTIILALTVLAAVHIGKSTEYIYLWVFSVRSAVECRKVAMFRSQLS
jgi:hypothetical protein